MKKAFVFDTNFIIENMNLTEVVSNLSEEFTVYIARVSIDERLSQMYLDLKKRYDRIEPLKKEFSDIAKIELRLTLDVKAKQQRDYVEQNYATLFGNNILPFQTDENTFLQILGRVHTKQPPFSSADGASDKGLKDTLLWISLMQFFERNDADEVVFLTNDNGFRKNAEALCAEFSAATGKAISINENNYYKQLIEQKASITPVYAEPLESPLPDVGLFREKIHGVVETLRGFETMDGWGNEGWENRFILYTKLDTESVELIFSRIRGIISSHLFETTIPADEVIQLGDGIKPEYDIPITALEDALMLFEEIRRKYPDFITQFYNAAAIILNANYVGPQAVSLCEVDDELPF